MKKTIITVGSVTYAAKAQRLLRSVNIPSKLVKIDPSYAPSGCTHGIEINYNDFISAAGELRRNNIQYNVISI